MKTAVTQKEKDVLVHPTSDSKAIQHMGLSIFGVEGMRKGPACGFYMQDLVTR